LGLDRLRTAVVCTADLAGPPEELVEVLAKALDFLVPELLEETVVLKATAVCIPRGGRWEVWDGGVKRVVASTLAIYDAAGLLVALKLMTRPRGKAVVRKGSLMLPVKVGKLALRADLRAISQRLLQFAAEFRPGRHKRVSQMELAEACERTKQAISHQRLLLTRKVAAATGGRGGFRGVRNLRGKGGVVGGRQQSVQP